MTESLRIGYVLKRYPRLSETFILNEILAHEAAGCELHIFSLRQPKEARVHEDVARVGAGVTYLAHDPVDVVEMGRTLSSAAVSLSPADRTVSFDRPKGIWTLWHAVQVASEAVQRGLTHLHAHFATEATAVARLASRISGIPYSLTAHAKDIFHESVDPRVLETRLEDASTVVTVSDFNIRYLAEQHPACGDRLRRIYNGLDLAEFAWCSGPRDPNLIVGVGRLVEKKGFEDLISACAVLRARGRLFKCRIIGDGELRTSLNELVRALDLQDCVELLGPRSRNEVRTIVAGASVVAAPCVVGRDGNRDGLPTVLLEAMALGTPCVSTPVTGIQEAVRHEETGLIVREHDPLALALAIERVLGDREYASKLAQAARRLIEEEFDLHANTRQLRDVFARSAPIGVP